MRYQSTWGRTLGICLVIVSGWWWVSRHSIVPSPAATFKAAFTTQAIPVRETIRIDANSVQKWPFHPPGDKFPGRLLGHWTCRGKAAGVQGAKDDTLVAFKLIGPDAKTIQQLDHSTSGNFDIRFNGPGVYTFEFNNGGVFRSSARVVEIDGTYQPD